MRHLSPATLIRLFIIVLILHAPSPRAHAQGGIVSTGNTSTPEIDPSMVGAGTALLGGITLVIRSTRKP